MVLPRHSSVPEAYSTLGIDQESSLDVVKGAYKKLALTTHPDKNPDNPDATSQFQKVSEAYNVLVKHLDRSSRPRVPSGFGFGPSGGGYYHDHDDDDFDAEYYDEDDEEAEEDMGFYMWMFEEVLRGRAGSRFNQSRYHHQFRRPKSPPEETPEEYEARLRRSREEQVAAEERRAREDAERKVRVEEERKKERQEAEKRQKAKKANKKGQAEVSRKKAEDTVRTQQQRGQTLRSSIFAAARSGDSEKVRKGIWEDSVDAAGGEIKKDCEAFVATPPNDPKETLMHIAVKHGDADLVEWLEAHSAEPDERNSQGLTAFHLAVQLGHSAIIKKPFFENYPPKEDEHSTIYSLPPPTSILTLALESGDPETVWLVLENGLASSQDIDIAWTLVSSAGCKAEARKIASSSGKKVEDWKLDEIRQLMMTFGGFTPPPTPKVEAQPKQREDPRPTKGHRSTKSQASLVPQALASGSSNSQPKTSKGRGRGCGRGRGN